METTSQFSAPKRKGEGPSRVICKEPQDFVETHKRLVEKLDNLDRLHVQINDAATELRIPAKRFEDPLGKIRTIQVLLASDEECKRNISLTPNFLGVIPTVTKFSRACAFMTHGEMGNALELGLIRSVFREAKKNNMPALVAAAKVSLESEVEVVRGPIEKFKELADDFHRNLRDIELEFRVYLGGKPKPSSALFKSAIAPIDRQFRHIDQLTSFENVKLDCWNGLTISSQAMELSRDIGTLALHVDAFRNARANLAKIITEELEKESNRLNKRREDPSTAPLIGVAITGASTPVPLGGSRLDRALQFAQNAITTFEALDTTEVVASRARAESLWQRLGPSGQRDITKHLSRLRSDEHIDETGELLAIHLVGLLQQQLKEELKADGVEKTDDHELLSLALEEIGLRPEDLGVVGRVSIEQIERISDSARQLGVVPEHVGILVRAKPDVVQAEQSILNKELVAFLGLASRAIDAGMRVELFSSLEEMESAIRS